MDFARFEQALYAHFWGRSTPIPIEEIAAASGLPRQDAFAGMQNLEAHGKVRQAIGGWTIVGCGSLQPLLSIRVPTSQKVCGFSARARTPIQTHESAGGRTTVSRSSMRCILAP